MKVMKVMKMKLPSCVLHFFNIQLYVIEQCFDFESPHILGIYTDFKTASKIHYCLTKGYRFEENEQISIHIIPANINVAQIKFRPQDYLLWENKKGRKYMSRSIREKYLEWTTL